MAAAAEPNVGLHSSSTTPATGYVFCYLLFSILIRIQFRLLSFYVLLPGYQSSMSGQQLSGSPWGSEHDAYNIHDNWMGMYNTPPPQPTQETQQEHDESLIPARDVRPPHRLGWTTRVHHLRAVADGMADTSRDMPTYLCMRAFYLCKTYLSDLSMCMYHWTYLSMHANF